MIQRATSFCLAALLAGMLIGGPCAACPSIIPIQKKAHDCCGQKPGDCCTPKPERAADNAPCPQLAMTVERTAPVAPLVAAAPVIVEAPSFAPVFFEAGREFAPLHPPPELYLLNATLLI